MPGPDRELPGQPEDLPLIPPDWFVANYNKERTGLGLRPATALDPNVMAMWHFCTKPAPAPLVIVTGI